MGQHESKNSNEEKEMSELSNQRWFWNSSKDPFNDDYNNHIWTPYPLHISAQLEDAFQSKVEKYEMKDEYQEYYMKFNYHTNVHLQIHKLHKGRQRPVKREYSKKISNMVRVQRHQLTREEKVDPYQNNQIDELHIFCYSLIFDNFQIDHADPLIEDFTSHFCFFDKKIIQFLTGDYINYLREYHTLKEEEFNFTKLKNILSVDLKYLQHKPKVHQEDNNIDQTENIPNIKLDSYSKYFLEKMTKENFREKIVQMYVEEGDLYKNMNKTLREMTIHEYKQYVFFLLCLEFVCGRWDKMITENITVYRGITVPSEAYQNILSIYSPGNVIINYDFISTSKSEEIGKRYINRENQPDQENLKKILFEITIEKEKGKFKQFFSFKPVDISLISQYKEEELLIPPNGIFEVRKIQDNLDENLGNLTFTTIQMDYRTNLFADTLPFILTEKEVQRHFGIYSNLENVSENEYKLAIQAVLVQVEIVFLHKLVNLRVLRIVIIGDFAMEVLSAQISALKHLQSFSCYYEGNESKIVSLSKQFQYLKGLRSFGLSGTELDIFGTSALAANLKELNELEYLDLENLSISWQLESIAPCLGDLKNLKSLSLSDNKIFYQHFVNFAKHVKNLKNLEELDLSFNYICDKGISMLAPQLIYLTKLNRLDLSCNFYSYAMRLIMTTLLKNDVNWTHKNSVFLLCGEFVPKDLRVEKTQRRRTFAHQIIQKNRKYQEEHVKLTNVTLNFLSDMSYYENVKSLTLQWDNLEDEGLKTFADQLSCLPKLESVNLSKNKFHDEGMIVFASKLESLSKLKYLDLGYNVIEKEGIEAFASQLIHLSNLECLNLEFNRILGEGMKMLSEQLKCITKLIDLNLKCNLIHDEGIKALAESLMHVPNLQYLNLSVNVITDDGLTVFSNQLQHIPNLLSLNLHWNSIRNTGLAALSSNFQYVTKLEYLNLSRNPLDEESFKIFAQNFEYLHNLQVLNLRNTQLTNVGLEAISSNLEHLSNLSVFSLEGNQIRDDGVKIFASQIYHMQHLQVLKMSDNEITDESVIVLASQFHQVPLLHTVDFSKCELTQDGMSKLKEIHGNIPLERNMKIILGYQFEKKK